MKINENERIDDLEYKGLKIIQNAKDFCFGIDSVLLSDYAKNIKEKATVVDIGTGSGVIGLLLCKKTKLNKTYGVEIQKHVAELAKRNIKLNKLETKFEVINKDIKDIFTHLEPNKIDVVVTNPPYKKANTGIINHNKTQRVARHEVECTLEDIIKVSSKLLKHGGEFYMVHRAERLVDIMCLLRENKIEPKNIRFVHTRQNEKPNLILIRAVKNAKEFFKIDKPLIIYKEDGKYTDEILRIYDKKEQK